MNTGADALVDNLSNILKNTFNTSDAKVGGKKLTKKGMYKKQLAKHTLDKIQTYAKKNNISITKRVDGKLVKLTKSSLINKLANKKFK